LLSSNKTKKILKKQYCITKFSVMIKRTACQCWRYNLKQAAPIRSVYSLPMKAMFYMVTRNMERTGTRSGSRLHCGDIHWKKNIRPEMKSYQLNARRLTKRPGAISIKNSIFKRQHICCLFFYNKPLFSPGGIYIEVLSLLLIIFHPDRLLGHHLKLQLR